MLTAHFIQRVAERMGEHVCARTLARHIIAGLDTGETVFVARLGKDGRRCFSFRDFDGRLFYVLIVTEEYPTCVTVFPPGMTIGRQGKEPLTLEKDTR